MARNPNKLLREYPELQFWKTPEARTAALRRALRDSRRPRPAGALLAIMLIACVGGFLLPFYMLLTEGQGTLADSTSAVLLITAIVGGVVLLGRWRREEIRCLLREQAAVASKLICLECGYDLRGQTEARCPECGMPFNGDLLRPNDQRKDAAGGP